MRLANLIAFHAALFQIASDNDERVGQALKIRMAAEVAKQHRLEQLLRSWNESNLHGTSFQRGTFHARIAKFDPFADNRNPLLIAAHSTFQMPPLLALPMHSASFCC